MIWVGVISQRLKRTLWKPGFLLRIVDCCEQDFILALFNGHLVSDFYWVRYPIRLRIRTRSWSVLYLEFSCWHSEGSALFFCSPIRIWLWFWSELDEKITSYVGEPLAKFWLLTSVGETDSDSGVTRTKKNLRGGTPCKILVARFGWWNWFNIKYLSGGTPCKITVVIFSWNP